MEINLRSKSCGGFDRDYIFQIAANRSKLIIKQIHNDVYTKEREKKEEKDLFFFFFSKRVQEIVICSHLCS